MELPNLLNLKKNKDVQSKKYVAIQIESEAVRAAVWEALDDQPSIVQMGSIEVVDVSQPKELLEAIDRSLSQALTGIDPEPDEMVLSLPDSWLVENDITPDKKQLLKFVSEKLEMKPIGFVITIEAVVHFLESSKGQPPNAIVLGISSHEVSVSLVQNGKISSTHVVGRSEDVGSDVEEGLARTGKVKQLPSNIVLYGNGIDLDQLQQDLIEYNWQDRLPFLHIPKIERLLPDDVITSVVMTSGLEVIQPQDAEASEESNSEASSEVDRSDDQELPDKQEDFGFKVTHPEPVHEVTDQDEDLTNLDEVESNVTPIKELPVIEPEDDDDWDDEEVDLEPKKPSLLSLLPFFGKKKKKKDKIPKGGGGIRIIIGLLVLLVALLGASGAAVAAYWYIPKAQITLYVEPRIISRDISFTVSSEATDLDESSGVIPGVPIETEVTADGETEATGEKLVGEKAKGQIILYNRTDSVKLFEKGTQLTGPNGTTYTLDEEIEIASASTETKANFEEVTTPARVESSITASNIGAEFNHDGEVEFSIANYDTSSFVAVSEDGTSGGTSREITAVSRDDIAVLREQVNQEIEEKILDQVGQNQEGFTGAIMLTDEGEEPDEDFSAEVGEEANTVTMTASLMIRSMTYKKSDVAKLIQAKIADQIPADYQLEEEDLEITIAEVDESNPEEIEVVATTRTKIVPEVDAKLITSTVRGKFPSVTEDFFKTLPGYSRVVIDIKPEQLPDSIKTFPRVESNIQVKVEMAEE